MQASNPLVFGMYIGSQCSTTSNDKLGFGIKCYESWHSETQCRTDCEILTYFNDLKKFPKDKYWTYDRGYYKDGKSCNTKCYKNCVLCMDTAPRKCGGFIAEKCPRGFRCSIFPPTKLSARRGLAAMFGKCVLDNSQRLVTKDQSTNDTLILMMVVVMFFCSCCVLLWFRNRQKEIARKQKGSSYVLMQD